MRMIFVHRTNSCEPKAEGVLIGVSALGVYIRRLVIEFQCPIYDVADEGTAAP